MKKKLPDLDELQKLIPKIHIEEKDMIRTCSVCKKSYKDKQIVVNGITSCMFALCPEYRKAYIRDYL